ARDTPAVMRHYLGRFDPSYLGLTAPLPTVEKAARSLGIAYTGKEKATGGGYEVGHGAQVIGFTGGEGRLVWMPETPVADLRADLTRLARG
ncbi:MAG: SCO family protein, partial [Kineosporiaceae bacterium]